MELERKELIEATCPECRGPLSEHRNNDLVDFRCLVGHRYSARSLLHAHSETQERTLWAAVVVLEESEKLVEAIADCLSEQELQRIWNQVAGKKQQATEIKAILEKLEAFQTD